MYPSGHWSDVVARISTRSPAQVRIHAYAIARRQSRHSAPALATTAPPLAPPLVPPLAAPTLPAAKPAPEPDVGDDVDAVNDLYQALVALPDRVVAAFEEQLTRTPGATQLTPRGLFERLVGRAWNDVPLATYHDSLTLHAEDAALEMIIALRGTIDNDEWSAKSYMCPVDQWAGGDRMTMHIAVVVFTYRVVSMYASFHVRTGWSRDC